MLMFRSALSAVTAFFLIVAGAGTGFAEPTDAPKTDAAVLELDSISPKDAGIRYGQAAGVALVCYGLRVTPLVEQLKSKFEGDAMATFDAHASKVVASWRSTLNCEHATGPNECKLSHTWSCRQALNEIGPKGSVLPGLVEQKVK
jgi:hypothetical protein